MFTNGNLAAPVEYSFISRHGSTDSRFGLGLVYSVLKEKVRPSGRLPVLGIAASRGALSGCAAALFFYQQRAATGARPGKHFCEIDCHLAYSVNDVREAKTLGESPNQLSVLAGMLRVVTIKTRFDENTIGPNRGNGLLYPNSRVVTVVDEKWKSIFPVVGRPTHP